MVLSPFNYQFRPARVALRRSSILRAQHDLIVVIWEIKCLQPARPAESGPRSLIAEHGERHFISREHQLYAELEFQTHQKSNHLGKRLEAGARRDEAGELLQTYRPKAHSEL